MYDQAVDGNLAALRQYEMANDEADIAWEHIKSYIVGDLRELESETDEDKIESLTDNCMYYADYLEGYDFTEMIADEIKEALGND